MGEKVGMLADFPPISWLRQLQLPTFLNICAAFAPVCNVVPYGMQQCTQVPIAFPHVVHKTKTFDPRIYDKNDMNRTIDMLCKHLQTFVQYSQVWQELSSCNTCEQDRKTTVHIFKTHIIFTQSQPNSLKLFYYMKRRTLYPKHPLASLSLHNDHCCDCGHVQKPQPSHSRHDERGGEVFLVFFVLFCFCFLDNYLSFRFSVYYSYCGYIWIIKILNIKYLWLILFVF